MRVHQAKRLVEEETSTYDSIASHFSQTRYGAGPFLNELAKDVPSDADILDIGCGNGRLVEALPKKVTYTGIDVSKKLLALSKELHPERKGSFHLFDGTSLEFGDEIFSHIYMLASFHHMPKPLQQEFINECARILKKDGKIIMTVWHLWRMPFIKYLLYSLPTKLLSRKVDLSDIYVPWKDKQGTILASRYFHMFRKREIETLFRRAGFKNVEVELVSLKKQKNYLVTANK